MNAVFAAQNAVVVALSFAAFAVEVFALVDALRHRPDAYTAAGKLTKGKWTLILGIAAAVGFVYLFGSPLGFLSIIGVVAAVVYLVDVRPALQAVGGRGGSSAGPYGGW